MCSARKKYWREVREILKMVVDRKLPPVCAISLGGDLSYYTRLYYIYTGGIEYCNIYLVWNDCYRGDLFETILL